MHKLVSTLFWVIVVVLSGLVKAGMVQMTPAIGAGILAASVSLVVWTYIALGPGRQYQEYLYQLLEPYDLPPQTREAFDQYAPDFLQLGFHTVEDARLQEEPYRHDVRLFLNPGGDIWGEISVIDEPSMRVVACVSVFDDGMKFETASTSTDKLPERQDRMQWNCLPGASVEEIYNTHREAIASYRAETGALLLDFAPDDFEDVVTYGHRLLWHWRRREGRTKQEIPEAVVPQPSRSAVLS